MATPRRTAQSAKTAASKATTEVKAAAKQVANDPGTKPTVDEVAVSAKEAARTVTEQAPDIHVDTTTSFTPGPVSPASDF